MGKVGRSASLRVAIVGMGPRGLSVLERLLARLAEQPVRTRVKIWLFDPGEPGAGRIWRTTQPDWFLMNTAAGEVSVYSAGPDGGPWRAGAGPSLAEWLAVHPDPELAALGPNDYPPRRVYGEYLHEAYRNMVANAPAGVTVLAAPARVRRIEPSAGGRLLYVDRRDRPIEVDRVVLTTGHPNVRPDRDEQRLVEFARHTPELCYLRGDSAADLALDAIRPGTAVGVIGLGLTFLDVLAALTIGRGGRFTDAGDGRLCYHPSGREPRFVAGSRSGLVMLARGRNQKAPDYRYQPVFATEFAIAAARRRAQRENGCSQVDFLRDVLPLLVSEVEHVYYTTHVRRRHGDRSAEQFAARHRELVRSVGLGRHEVAPDSVAKLLTEFGLSDVPPVDLPAMARPFAGERFDSQAAFHARLTALLLADADEADRGNLDSPLKAALDILRDIRGSVRQAVDFGGLRPQSHRDDFLNWYNPINTMLSAGPPLTRVRQVCALIESGLLTVVGPELRIDHSAGRDAFVLSSPQVPGVDHAVTTLIDARIPRPRLDHDADPLLRQLLADGMISEYVPVDPLTGTEFHTGSLAVTRTPFHVVRRDGVADPCLYGLGIPTENTRWFTQIGNGRPGPMSGFHVDADAIAVDLLAATARAIPETTDHVSGDDLPFAG